MTKEELLENISSGVLKYYGYVSDGVMEDIEAMELEGKSYDDMWKQFKLWDEMQIEEEYV